MNTSAEEMAADRAPCQFLEKPSDGRIAYHRVAARSGVAAIEHDPASRQRIAAGHSGNAAHRYCAVILATACRAKECDSREQERRMPEGDPPIR